MKSEGEASKTKSNVVLEESCNPSPDNLLEKNMREKPLKLLQLLMNQVTMNVVCLLKL